VKEGSYYYFAFEGSTPQPFAQSKWSSGLARSTNLTSVWTRFPGNPMIPQTSGGMGYDGPELLRLGEAWYLYVRTPGGNQTERFRLEARPQRPKSVRPGL
jgi:beta-xylosidase